MKTITSTICLLLLVSVAFGQKGELASNFSLDTIQGQKFNLQDFQGNVILVNFWSANCKACKKELPELLRLWDSYRRLGFIVLAVSVDENFDTAKRFIQKHNIKLVTLHDPTKQTAVAYNVKKIPSSYLIDKTGTIRHVQKGFSFDKIKKLEKQITALLNEPKLSSNQF